MRSNPSFLKHDSLAGLYSGLHYFASIAVVLTVIFSTSRSEATVVVNAVAGASNFVRSATNQNDITVYGGIAGDNDKGPASDPRRCGVETGADTCNNCHNNSQPGNARLIPCNNTRIYPSLRLTITYVSDGTGGTPLITTDSASPVAVQIESFNPAIAVQNQPVTVTVRWSSVCTNLTVQGSGSAGDCGDTSTTLESLSGTLRVGVSKDNNGEFASSADYARVKFIVRRAMESLTDHCSLSPSGLCYFEMGSGDKKAVLKSPEGRNGFPVYQNITFRAVRVLYEKGSDHTLINPGSTFEDLTVNTNGDNATSQSFTISPTRVTNGIENEQPYVFKVAVVDLSGNVGLYTRDEQFGVCSPDDPGATGGQCHTAVPGEVVGVLSEDVKCFISTAAFGSAFAPQVRVFRAFRDVILLKDSWGRAFVNKYYELSPPLADYIADRPALRAISRVVLYPALGFASLSLQIGLVNSLLVLGCLLSISIGLVYFSLQRRRLRA